MTVKMRGRGKSVVNKRSNAIITLRTNGNEATRHREVPLDLHPLDIANPLENEETIVREDMTQMMKGRPFLPSIGKNVTLVAIMVVPTPLIIIVEVVEAANIAKLNIRIMPLIVAIVERVPTHPIHLHPLPLLSHQSPSLQPHQPHVHHNHRHYCIRPPPLEIIKSTEQEQNFNVWKDILSNSNDYNPHH